MVVVDSLSKPVDFVLTLNVRFVAFGIDVDLHLLRVHILVVDIIIAT